MFLLYKFHNHLRIKRFYQQFRYPSRYIQMLKKYNMQVKSVICFLNISQKIFRYLYLIIDMLFHFIQMQKCDNRVKPYCDKQKIILACNFISVVQAEKGSCHCLFICLQLSVMFTVEKYLNAYIKYLSSKIPLKISHTMLIQASNFWTCTVFT